MNMFIIIISFLMTTAVFAKMAIVDVYLPQEGGGNGGQATFAAPAILTVSVLENGFEMGGVGGGRLIPRKDGNLDYRQLTEELIKIKGSYPDKEDAILLFPAEMPRAQAELLGNAVLGHPLHVAVVEQFMVALGDRRGGAARTRFKRLDL